MAQNIYQDIYEEWWEHRFGLYMQARHPRVALFGRRGTAPVPPFLLHILCPRWRLFLRLQIANLSQFSDLYRCVLSLSDDKP